MISLPGVRLDSTTAEIKRAVDIVDLVGEYVRLEPSTGSKFRGLCPFHDDHRPSLDVDRQRQSYRCWACGEKGDIFTFLERQEKLTFREALERLAERAGIPLTGRRNRNDHVGRLLEVLAWAQVEFQNCLFDPCTGAEARQYLSKRSLREETARRFGLGVAPDSFGWLLERARRAGIEEDWLVRSDLAKPGQRGAPYDTFRGRLMFPIRDERGRTVGFGGRVLPSIAERDPRKYVNSAATDVYNKSEILYGLDVAGAALRSSDRRGPRSVAVMEGYTDCLMAYQAGFLEAVATCGTALTPRQIAKLRRHADRVVLMFDGDAMGQKGARRAMELFLEAEVEIRLCSLPDGLDPCDFISQRGIEPLRARVDEAPDALEFLIDQVRRSHDLSSVAGRQQAVEEALATLASVPARTRADQRIKYELAMNRLAGAVGVGEAQLWKRVEEIRGARNRGPQPPSNSDGPLSAGGIRERRIVAWLVARPDQAGQIMPDFPADELGDPDLRELASASYRLHEELGALASLDALRERIEDPRLRALALELADSVPTDTAFEEGLREIQNSLQSSRRRLMRSAVRARLSSESSGPDHLALLRQVVRHERCGEESGE